MSLRAVKTLLISFFVLAFLKTSAQSNLLLTPDQKEALIIKIKTDKLCEQWVETKQRRAQILHQSSKFGKMDIVKMREHIKDTAWIKKERVKGLQDVGIYNAAELIALDNRTIELSGLLWRRYPQLWQFSFDDLMKLKD